MSNETIDKMLEHYWAHKFDSAHFFDGIIFKDKWEGFFKVNHLYEKHMILGQPINDVMWYCSNGYFSGGCDMFNLSIGSFNDSMSRYVKKTYGIDTGLII